MITGTGCRNAVSASHRLPPIADALPYAAVTSFLVRCIMQDPSLASPTSGIHAVSLCSAGANCDIRHDLRTIESP